MKILFILDKDTEFLTDGLDFGYQVVSSISELEALSDDLDQFKAIVVLAEPNWKEKSQEIFYGFEIACRLRREFRQGCPIVITSSFEKNVFEALSKKNQEKFNILYGSGTDFLHLEELHEKIQANDLSAYLESLPSLSDAAIEDMLEMLLQQKGFLIDKITHDLKFFLNEEYLQNALNAIGSYLSSRQKNELNYTGLSGEIIKAHQNNKQETFNAAKEKLVNACAQNLGQGTKDTTAEIQESSGKILVVEDDPDQRKVMTKKLQDYFQLVVTGDSRRAIEILKADKNNNITAVIADWRLLKYDKAGNKTEYWQDYQGYQVLEKASQSHFAALISLTAEHDKNVHQIRNQLGINIQLFKKQHIYASGDHAQWGMFIDIVREKCNEITTLISSIPTAAKWRKYSAQYRKVRLSTQWTTFEKEISEQANQFWNYFKDSLDLDKRGNVNKGLQDDNMLPLNKLKNVLIGRRLFFALYYEFQRLRNDATVSSNPEQLIRIERVDRGSAVLDTFAALRNDWWYTTDVSDKKGKFDQYDQRKKNLLKDLCIKSEEIGRMFPEEKVWLTKQGIDYKIQKVKFESDQDDSFKDDDEPEEASQDREPTADELKNVDIPSDDDIDDELDH